MTKFPQSSAKVWGLAVALCVSVTLLGSAGAEDTPQVAAASSLDHGFSGLYNLDFAGAQRDFTAWQVLHPDDPVGPVSEAAGFLFI